MKKSLLALAALTAFTGVASAQSSVTLFGIVDLSVNRVKNGSREQTLLSPDQLNSNRLGFRGVEDLGGGMRAGFWLEGAMSPDNGTAGGQTWQRRSTVSLMGGFGEIRLGRDYTPSFWNYTIFDPFGTNGPGSMLSLVSTLGSGAGTLVRANNTVGYFLPAAGGVYGQLQGALGEGVAGNKYSGLRIGYAGGPINVAGAYGLTERDGAMIDDYTDMNVGLSAKMGAFTLITQYSQREYGAADQKTILVGGTLSFGQSTLKASFVDTSGTGTALDAKMVAVGYQYDLSKRTALYGTFSKLDNDGTAVMTVGQGPAQTTGGASSTAFSVGIRHSF